MIQHKAKDKPLTLNLHQLLLHTTMLQ